MSERKFKQVGTRPIRHDGLEKVTGRANFGADISLPGMPHGKVLRSPHAHARIRSIDVAPALALEGVKVAITSADLPEIPHKSGAGGEGPVDFADVSCNVMAREKALYDGHAVAAVAATSKLRAEEAVRLIEVEYEVLPHVIDVDDPIKPDAPVMRRTLDDDMLEQLEELLIAADMGHEAVLKVLAKAGGG